MSCEAAENCPTFQQGRGRTSPISATLGRRARDAPRATDGGAEFLPLRIAEPVDVIGVKLRKRSDVDQRKSLVCRGRILNEGAEGVAEFSNVTSFSPSGQLGRREEPHRPQQAEAELEGAALIHPHFVPICRRLRRCYRS